ncbi:uncharacterized protein L3040_008328 [Drepanopeziza brunnea f. sp. 'multigermtubi']|uniref:Pre-mRNA-splicing factor 38 n=1 Tax=Marssonina brunnea f. sp. multigermtubi (strain MB_m1) TaxID=1072389 RepID=K1WAK9_MARBU|nr:PRP38 family protein [Drepanopeziza brunnea f. sp. 'multigermtubi' MB_m1]EKD14320.1 PRP38 family protein [Drepanopeziza brunnea f. sp. 'multigermtubi' MB_m1]KAJ5035066.1 hypothetical protein L3040_008328 [Drepanopeziza brunnea f. sp. 'multigermtubi']
MANHRADEKRFLDERGSGGPLAPNGLNPATIMEKPVRERIVDCYFWKDQCFAVNEADIVDRVVAHVTFIGGTYGDAQRPSPFLCLAFKLLQLGPTDEILTEYLEYGGEKFKYLRALAMFYIRLTRQAKDVYRLLEPFLADYRKLKRRGRMGTSLTYVDVFADELLVKDRVCGTTLWKMPKREILEDLDVLEPRVSALGEDIDALLEQSDEMNGGNGDRSGSERSRSPGSEFGEVTPDERDEMELDGREKSTNGDS